MSTTTPFYSYRDDGPITISFYDFRRSNLPGNAPREQREHVTRAFYTGALAGIKCLRDLARRRSVIIPDDVDHLAEELRQETLREADAAAVGDPDDAG